MRLKGVVTVLSGPAHIGIDFRDAATGKDLWTKPSPDVGRGVAFDIDPLHRGYEMWASGQALHGLWDAKGNIISEQKPKSCNFAAWWDGDLLRELLDGNQSLHIYTTTIPTKNRLITLMQDSQYRLSVAWQNDANNQPTQPGFYLGGGMKLSQPRPKIFTSPVKPDNASSTGKP